MCTPDSSVEPVISEINLNSLSPGTVVELEFTNHHRAVITVTSPGRYEMDLRQENGEPVQPVTTVIRLGIPQNRSRHAHKDEVLPDQLMINKPVLANDSRGCSFYSALIARISIRK
jgi:hypothetical protein